MKKWLAAAMAAAFLLGLGGVQDAEALNLGKIGKVLDAVSNGEGSGGSSSAGAAAASEAKLGPNKVKTPDGRIIDTSDMTLKLNDVLNNRDRFIFITENADRFEAYDSESFEIILDDINKFRFKFRFIQALNSGSVYMDDIWYVVTMIPSSTNTGLSPGYWAKKVKEDNYVDDVPYDRDANLDGPGEYDGTQYITFGPGEVSQMFYKECWGVDFVG